MRIANTVNDSIVDGHGLRFAVFTQGCPHHCPGCHNPQTHDPAGGRPETRWQDDDPGALWPQDGESDWEHTIPFRSDNGRKGGNRS